MDDYIDSVIDSLHGEPNSKRLILYENSYNDGGLLIATKPVKELPSADVVEVVRCKDCKRVYCRTYQDWQEPIYTCTHFRNRWNPDYCMEVNPDDFCSYGERREE